MWDKDDKSNPRKQVKYRDYTVSFESRQTSLHRFQQRNRTYDDRRSAPATAIIAVQRGNVALAMEIADLLNDDDVYNARSVLLLLLLLQSIDALSH